MLRTLFLLLLLTAAWPSSAAERVSVEVVGIKGELLKNALAYLEIEKRRKDPELSDRWIQLLHENAPDQIRNALIPFGYYGVEVDSSLQQAGTGWRAVYRVKPGPPTRVSSVDVRFVGAGSEEPVLQAAAAGFPLRVGDILDHQRYEQGKEALLDAAFAQGYARATPQLAKTQVDTQAHKAEMMLLVDTGPRYYFGELTIRQDFLDPELVQKFVTITPGTPYSNEALLALQQGLQSTDWASTVTLSPDFTRAEGDRVPIEMTLLPSKRHFFKFGLGYETDIGPRLTARWLGRRLTSSGHHADVYMRLAPINRELSGTYYIPINDPKTDRFTLGARYEYEETSDTSRNTFDGEAAYTRKNREDTLFRKLFVQLKRETFAVGDEPDTSTTILSLGATARFTRLQDAFFSQRGVHAYADLRGGSSSLLSDTSFLRLTLRGKYLFPVGKKGRFLLHGEVGQALVEDFSLYPTSLRYFAGGDTSIRGYEYKSLGPVDDQGFVQGGKNLLLLNAEYDYRVAEKWLVAGFVDSGNAYNDKLETIHVGSGFGLRWLFGFGNLRLDLAWPVSDDEVDIGDYRIHIGFGAIL